MPTWIEILSWSNLWHSYILYLWLVCFLRSSWKPYFMVLKQDRNSNKFDLWNVYFIKHPFFAIFFSDWIRHGEFVGEWQRQLWRKTFHIGSGTVYDLSRPSNVCKRTECTLLTLGILSNPAQVTCKPTKCQENYLNTTWTAIRTLRIWLFYIFLAHISVTTSSLPWPQL